jgi:putative tryptophan/tyrosine transport system substrate-binding protein
MSGQNCSGLAPIGEPEYRRAFLTLARERVDILVVTEHVENYAHQRVIARLAADARLPTMYPYQEAIEMDGLMAYSADLSKMHRWVAGYIDRILRGTNPGELPIQQPTKFVLGINVRAAKALGLTIPPLLLLQAERVIE